MCDSYNCKKQKSHPGSLCKWKAWWKLSPQRYVYFLKLQNFLRINFCKVPCFERRLHIVSEKFGSFCCYSDCFAAKILFYLKNLLINSLFSFIFLYFCRAFAINALVNNNFDMKIVELKYSNGVVGDPYAEDLCHSVNTLINYIAGNYY